MNNSAPFVHQRRIKFGETDAASIVYTPRFADFCMEAAEVWFRDYLGFDWYRENISLGLGTPVVHMEIDFKSSLGGGDILAVEVLVGRVGARSLTLVFNGVKNALENSVGEHSFSGKFVYCFTSVSEGGAIAISEQQIAAINNYIDQCAPPSQ